MFERSKAWNLVLRVKRSSIYLDIFPKYRPVKKTVHHSHPYSPLGPLAPHFVSSTYPKLQTSARHDPLEERPPFPGENIRVIGSLHS